jgi:hypothetical protein
MSGWIAFSIGGIIAVLWVVLTQGPRPPARQPPDRFKLKKTADPARYVDRQLRVLGVTVFWLATIATFGMTALSAVSGLGGFSVVLGLTFGLGVGAVVYGVEGNRLSAKERRKTEEQLRAVRRRADNDLALGPHYASIVETTLAAVRYDIGGSEAARAGLLGDIDFDADIRGITDNLRKAHELQKVADKLAALDKPSADDRKILAEAKTTVAKLETTALNRVELIAQCAAEAQLVDKSLHEERQDAKTSAQRAELHAKLAAMLYGIEATPDTTPTDSGADAVLLRVRAYREIKNQIRLGRD